MLHPSIQGGRGVNLRRSILASGGPVRSKRAAPSPRLACANGCRFAALCVILNKDGDSAAVDYPVFVKMAAAISSKLMTD